MFMFWVICAIKGLFRYEAVNHSYFYSKNLKICEVAVQKIKSYKDKQNNHDRVLSKNLIIKVTYLHQL